ncbi:MAG TPA: hypothetical protein VND68_14135 [Chloroflexia bacterium]|jgi:uncharacterized protein (TIGR02588 family)|nr:hypothetical protein [Chloroflexia bacterium]
MSNDRDSDNKRANGGGDDQQSGGQGRGREKGESGGEEKQERTTAEWVSLFISVAIVLALVGGLVYQIFAGGHRPPTIDVKPLMEEIRREGDSYYLSLDITNSGDRTAENVEVMLSLDSGEGDPETMQFQVQFLDGGETENQTVIFKNNPAEGELTHTASFHVP